MKPHGIIRSVQSSRHERAAGEAPSLGRVARIPGTGLPKGERHKRKNTEERQGRHRANHRWSILLGGVVLVAIAMAMGVWLDLRMKAGEVEAAVMPVAAADKKQGKELSKFASLPSAEVLALVKHALLIRQPEKVAEYFRLDHASPREVVGFLRGLEASDGMTAHYKWLGSLDANGLSLDGVSVTFKNGERQRKRLALLTPDNTGKWKIDFDALACTVTPSWSEFLEKSTDVAQVRVYIAKDSYYNGPFKDEQQWICYGMASPDMEDVLLGYCKAGSLQAQAMSWMISKRAKLTRATLEIRRMESSEPRQFEISKVLAEDWVMGELPFEEGFK